MGLEKPCAFAYTENKRERERDAQTVETRYAMVALHAKFSCKILI